MALVVGWLQDGLTLRTSDALGLLRPWPPNLGHIYPPLGQEERRRAPNGQGDRAPRHAVGVLSIRSSISLSALRHGYCKPIPHKKLQSIWGLSTSDIHDFLLGSGCVYHVFLPLFHRHILHVLSIFLMTLCADLRVPFVAPIPLASTWICHFCLFSCPMPGCLAARLVISPWSLAEDSFVAQPSPHSRLRQFIQNWAGGKGPVPPYKAAFSIIPNSKLYWSYLKRTQGRRLGQDTILHLGLSVDVP